MWSQQPAIPPATSTSAPSSSYSVNTSNLQYSCSSVTRGKTGVTHSILSTSILFLSPPLKRPLKIRLRRSFRNIWPRISSEWSGAPVPLLFKRKRIDPHAHQGASPTCTTSQHSKSFLLFSPPIKKKKPCKHRLVCAIKIQSWEDHQRSERPFGGLVYLVLFPPPPPLPFCGSYKVFTVQPRPPSLVRME